jgi:hypothetical protein
MVLRLHPIGRIIFLLNQKIKKQNCASKRFSFTVYRLQLYIPFISDDSYDISTLILTTLSEYIDSFRLTAACAARTHKHTHTQYR